TKQKVSKEGSVGVLDDSAALLSIILELPLNALWDQDLVIATTSHGEQFSQHCVIVGVSEPGCSSSLNHGLGNDFAVSSDVKNVLIASEILADEDKNV
ncbi:MAG: hypothetical protein M1823_007786, partial [Watsoniomyces obsoletus]